MSIISNLKMRIMTLNRGKWTIDQDSGKLVDYVEKTKPTSTQIKIDICEPFISNADGKVYTSKKKYRESLKFFGYAEVGDQIEALHKLAEKPDPFTDPEYQKQLAEDIEKSRNQVKYNEAPLTELEKEICKRQNEAIQKGE